MIGVELTFSNDRIALIGNGSQAHRIKESLRSHELEPDCIYNPSLRKGDIRFTDDFENVRECGIIFICSPNNTHFDYLESLIGDRYIFCEKPPVQTENQIDSLRELDNGKIHYNFNLRYSELSKFLIKSREYGFGELISASITISHGLATKQDYHKSWRSDSSLCPKGIFEIVSIHVIDLVGYHFDIDSIDSNKLTNRSGIGNSYDTANATIILSNSGKVEVFSTYAAPYYEHWNFVFENGILIADPTGITLRGPRDVFDSRGFFILPPIIEKQQISMNEDYEKSIERSVSFFLDTAMSKSNFDPNRFIICYFLDYFDGIIEL